MELLLIIAGLVVVVLLTHHLTGRNDDDDAPQRDRGPRREPTIAPASTAPRGAHGEGLARWRDTPGESGPTGNHPMTLLYRDGEGDDSERAITLKRLQMKMGQLYLDAYCHARAAPRTFRADRIVALTDGATGEVVADDVVQWLVDHHGPVHGAGAAAPRPAAPAPASAPAAAPPRQGGAAMKAIWITAAVLAVLYFIGKDGGDTVSMADVRNSAVQKYTDSDDKRGFARVVIGISGHACGTVEALDPPVEVGTTLQILARCDTGGPYALALSQTSTSVQTVDCRVETATVCP